MTAAIFDFPTIGKEARLKALEGRAQNVVQPMGVDPGVAPVEFDPYGMYAGFADTAPAEWSAPDFDPA